MKLAEALAARLKELREASGLSQQEVAIRADLSLSLVAKLEQGKKADPRASTLLALAGALGVPPGRLLEDLPLDPEDEVQPAKPPRGKPRKKAARKAVRGKKKGRPRQSK